MDFLDCAKLLQQESSGIQTLTAVENQTGELKRLADWTSQAHEDIQSRHENWRWMRKQFTVTTVSGTDTYAPGDCTDVAAAAPISRFDRWLTEPGTVKIYLQSAGEGTSRWLTFVPWDEFRLLYRLQPQPDSAPAFWTVDPDENLVLGPGPDAAYVVVGDYQRSPLVWTAGTEEPEFPARFHRLIVWEALKKYALFESAQEVLARANKEASPLWAALRRSQLPPTGFGNPLA